MDVAIIYQQQVPTCPENQLKKHEMSEREESQTSVFVLFYPGPESPVGKSTTFSLSAGMLPGVAVTESCHCRLLCPLHQGLSPAAPAGLGAPSKGAGPCGGSPSPRTCSILLLAPCPSRGQPGQCSGLGRVTPGPGCAPGMVPRAQAAQREQQGQELPRDAWFAARSIRPLTTPHRLPGIPVPAHSHRTQQHLHGSLAPHLCCACPGLQSSEQALGLSSPFSQAAESY